jgi:hypothetical protein
MSCVQHAVLVAETCCTVQHSNFPIQHSGTEFNVESLTTHTAVSMSTQPLSVKKATTCWKTTMHRHDLIGIQIVSSGSGPGIKYQGTEQLHIAILSD